VALDAPAALDAIIGQDEAVALLRRAVEGGRVAHAWAFIGPHGAGRRTTALAFAKALVAPSSGAAVSVTVFFSSQGKLVAERAKDKGIKAVVFDRGGYHYHGRVKALAEAAREAGLEF